MKSMLEKLTEQYEWVQKLGIKGGAVGYYLEEKGVVQLIYDFPEGTFTLRHMIIDGDERFCLWHYEAKNYSRPYDPLWDKEDEFVLEALKEEAQNP